MVKQQAAPFPAPLLQGPPPKMQAAPIVPHAPSAVRRPAGKHYNQSRGPPPPRPQAASIIGLPYAEEHPIALGPDLVDISVESSNHQDTLGHQTSAIFYLC